MNWKFCEIALCLIELMIMKPLKHLSIDGIPIPNTAMSIGNWPQQHFPFDNLVVYQPMMEISQWSRWIFLLLLLFCLFLFLF